MQLLQCIVIVDDERSVRSGLTNLLQSEGYVTRAFESAEALLTDKSGLNDAALFIIDVELQGMSGFELFKELVKRFENPSGIIISGNSDENMLWYAMSLGALAFMQKPIDIDLLCEYIRQEFLSRAICP